MKKTAATLIWVGKILLGCALFALGFDLFLEPNALNAGGISGLAMVFVHVTKLGSVGLVSLLLNVPLFLLGGKKIGKRFSWAASLVPPPAPCFWICLPGYRHRRRMFCSAPFTAVFW